MPSTTVTGTPTAAIARAEPVAFDHCKAEGDVSPENRGRYGSNTKKNSAVEAAMTTKKTSANFRRHKKSSLPRIDDSRER